METVILIVVVSINEEAEGEGQEEEEDWEEEKEDCNQVKGCMVKGGRGREEFWGKTRVCRKMENS